MFIIITISASQSQVSSVWTRIIASFLRWGIVWNVAATGALLVDVSPGLGAGWGSERVVKSWKSLLKLFAADARLLRACAPDREPFNVRDFLR
jgi:hypothetical protein